MGLSIYLGVGAWHWSTEDGLWRERRPAAERALPLFFGVLTSCRPGGYPHGE
jgi:hypothetical protein